MLMNNLPILYVTASYHNFVAVFYSADNKLLGFTGGKFQSCYDVDDELNSKGIDIAQMVIGAAQRLGFTQIRIEIRGPQSSRLLKMDYLGKNGVSVSSIRNKTPIPHNGCISTKRMKLKNKRKMSRS